MHKGGITIKYKWTGRILLIVSMGFVFFKLRSFQLDIKEYITWNNSITLLVAVTLIMLSTICLGVGWGEILRELTGKKIPQKEISNIYIKSNLSKYIPGNVMQFVGRNILAKEQDISQQMIALSTVYEIGILGLIGSSIIVISGQVKTIINFLSLKVSVVLMIIGVVILVILVVLKVNSKHVGYFKNINYKRILQCAKKSIVFYVMGLVLMGISFVIVLYTFNSLDITINNAFLFIGIFILAWFIGFITPGVPGGIGIREAVLMIYLGNLFSDSYIVELVAIHRVITIISDVGIYLINVLKARGRNNNE